MAGRALTTYIGSFLASSCPGKARNSITIGMQMQLGVDVTMKSAAVFDKRNGQRQTKREDDDELA
jgi:hypothetical protein